MKRRAPPKRRAPKKTSASLTMGDVVKSQLEATKKPAPFVTALSRVLAPVDVHKWLSLAVEWTDVVRSDRAAVRMVDRAPPHARPVLETIEGFLQATHADGPIVRSRITEDPIGARCGKCRRRASKPMSTHDALDARLAVGRAGLDDAIAFAFARTSVLVTQSNLLRICRCDLRAWRMALDEYKRDPRAAWRSFSIDLGRGPPEKVTTP